MAPTTEQPVLDHTPGTTPIRLSRRVRVLVAELHGYVAVGIYLDAALVWRFLGPVGEA